MVTLGAKVTTANNPQMEAGTVVSITEFGFMAEYHTSTRDSVTLYWLWTDIGEYALVIS